MKTDTSIPLRGRQPKLDKVPATDQMPGGFSDSVAAQYFVAGVRLKKAGVQPEEGWRVFGYFLHEQKVPRGAGVEPPPTSTGSG